MTQSKLTTKILLYELLSKIESLEEEVRCKALISAFPELANLTLDNKEVVEATRAAYDLLTTEQQGLIDNYADLIAAERRIIELEEDLEAEGAASQFKEIHASPLAKTYINIQIQDKNEVEAALSDYQVLSLLAQSKLTAEKILLDELLAKIESLEEEVAYIKHLFQHFLN